MQSKQNMVDKGSKVYNRLMESCFLVKFYSTHDEGKYVVAERIIRTLKNKTYKDITFILKNIYIGK